MSESIFPRHSLNNVFLERCMLWWRSCSIIKRANGRVMSDSLGIPRNSRIQIFELLRPDLLLSFCRPYVLSKIGITLDSGFFFRTLEPDFHHHHGGYHTSVTVTRGASVKKWQLQDTNFQSSFQRIILDDFFPRVKVSVGFLGKFSGLTRLSVCVTACHHRANWNKRTCCAVSPNGAGGPQWCVENNANPKPKTQNTKSILPIQLDLKCLKHQGQLELWTKRKKD